MFSTRAQIQTCSIIGTELRSHLQCFYIYIDTKGLTRYVYAHDWRISPTFFLLLYFWFFQCGAVCWKSVYCVPISTHINFIYSSWTTFLLGSGCGYFALQNLYHHIAPISTPSFLSENLKPFLSRVCTPTHAWFCISLICTFHTQTQPNVVQLMHQREQKQHLSYSVPFNITYR